MKKYTPEIEEKMLVFFNTLSEKNKRHFAALESRKLGHGGQVYIAQILGVSVSTIHRGLKEINSKNLPPKDRTRRVGGGRKPYDKKSVLNPSTF